MKRAWTTLRLIVAASAVATSAILPARGDYLTFDIASHEARADYARFESRSWAADAVGEGGRLERNTVWSGDERVIVSDIYIPSGVTLTINAGTVVKFREGTRIKVEDGGSLVINGASGNEVVLEGYNDETVFTGIVLQSSAASYSDNTFVIVRGFNFGRYATVSLNNTTAFLGGGQALVPVDVSGSRDTAFSFDWVAETNGVTFASGTMSWNRVSDGRKNITVPYPDGLPGCSNFVIRAVTFRCCSPSASECIVTLSEFITSEIFSHEAMAEYIAFESREWAAGMEGEGGRLATNATWSGKHTIVSDVYIPSGVTLTLTADTVVEFCEGTRIKIEDGGTLNIVGADGHDVILRGAEGVANFGGIVKMPNGTFTDNSYFRFEGFTYGALANVALHDSSTFRSSGLALIPVTVSGSRSTAFSIDWVAETNGAPYKTGTLKWNSVSDGTKNISINYGAELDGYTNFTLRAAVYRACKTSPNTCTIKISDFIVSDIASHESMAEYIRFESRDWAADLEGEGGRLAANATWEGTHKIASDVYIPSGVTLTLAADTVVEFYEGTRIKIEDGGTLNIVGANGHDVIIRGAEGVTNYVGIVKMPNGTYTDNMYVQYTGKPYSAYPYITVHEATTYRDAGKMWIAFSLSGTTRNQSFNVDWSTDKGDSGTLTWSSSSDGTKWIEIPIAAEPVGGTTNHVINVTAARGCNISVGTSVLTVLEPDYNATGQVALTEGDAQSNDFAVNGGIKTQPLFLNDTETVQYSGKWQPYDANEAAVLRVTLETDNGATVLKEASPSETGAFDLNLKQYPVGYYTLKHEILNDLGETLATMQKTFSIADDEDVVLHGGVLTSNEVWAADKVHVVYETVVVPSIYTIFIEPGAIVKFMTGTGIDISQGGAFFANRIVFTHINDDTVGGDTLNDGFTVAPPMDAYFLSGAFTFGDDTELRGITQNNALTGTIATQKTLSRGSTYRVSGTLTIASGGSLTIPPGTVLKMEDKAAIVVNSGATLNAIGTRAAPITFTSIKDDTISGDTNGDGSNTIPQPGDWEEIKNNGGTMNLAFVTALYGGYGQYANQGDAIIRTANGETKMDCCVIKHSNLRLVGRTGGTVYAENCILEDGRWGIDGAVTFVNGVIANCNTGANGATLKNSILWVCDTYASGGTASNCVAYGEIATVQTGMTYADPLFVDPENGDFRVKEGSPCVDAADGAVAPELDFYGQPRITITDHGDELVGQLADIGVCEVMPRDVVSDIDLVPQSVRTTTNAVPGQFLFVKWEIANVGGREVEAAWRDTVSLVSESGREVVLGVKTTSSRIGVGGSVFCSAYFTVPAIAEGTWYPKVNVNSYHDIFEGSLAANNALTGERAVSVGLEALDPSISREGVINGGTPTVLKLAFGENDDNRMVVFAVPAGVKATWGFGFMPGGSRSVATASGFMTATSDGVMFRVPDGATDVYVVLESDTTTTYNLSTESTQMTITGVTPATLPSSGTTTLTITGAGFGETNAVSLISSVGRVALNAPQKDASGNLIATVDCATLTAGQTYAVRVESGENAAELQGAVAVTKVEGKGHFWARLTAPDIVRKGRKMSCYVEYGNDGNADISAQVLQVSINGDGILQYLFGTAGFDVLQFFASGDYGSAGILRPGSSYRIMFTFIAGEDNALSLHTSEKQEYAPDEWNTNDAYLLALSKAAGRLAVQGRSPNDYYACKDLAYDMATNVCSSSISGIVRLQDFRGNADSMSVIAFDNQTSNTYYGVIHDGHYIIENILPGTYALTLDGLGMLPVQSVVVSGMHEDVIADISENLKRSVAVCFSGGTLENLHVTAHSIDGGSEYPAFPNDVGNGFEFYNLPTGDYDVEVKKGDEVCAMTALSFSGKFTELCFDEKIIGVSALTIKLPDRTCSTNIVCFVMSHETAFFGEYAGFEPSQEIEIKLPYGRYSVVIVDLLSQSSELMENIELSDDRAVVSPLIDVKQGQSIKMGNRLLGDSIGPDPNSFVSDYQFLGSWANEVMARPIEPIPEDRRCKHNIDRYQKAVDAKNRLSQEIIKFRSLVDRYRYLFGVYIAARNSAFFGLTASAIASQYGIGVSLFQSWCEAVGSGEVTPEDMRGMFRDVGLDIVDNKVYRGGVGLGTLATIFEQFKRYNIVFKHELAMLKAKKVLSDAMSGFMQSIISCEDAVAAAGPYPLCCKKPYPDPPYDPPTTTTTPIIAQSIDPNEMVGPLGVGDPETQRFVKPGEELTYTIYFENKTNATAAAQEVYVTNSLSQYLDWSTFKMHEVAFGDQIDLGLVDKSSGVSEVTMKGTNFIVRTELVLEENGDADTRDACPCQARWYMRIVDPTTDTGWPKDIVAGFLPPNDETHRGEGHITYSICVRADAPANLVISNSADIVFDHNPSIKTDPAWWNTVVFYHTPTLDLGDGVTTNLLLIAGQPFGELPTPPERKNYTFDGWYTGPNGTGIKATSDAIVPDGEFELYENWIVNGGIAKFEECELVADEGSNAVVRVYGGSDEKASSVNVYLTYNTAAAADIDLKTAAVSSTGSLPVQEGNAQAARSTGLKFPLTLTWAKGEIGEKVITIPVKTDKTVEGDEFFTLQLAEAEGMELGEERVCTVTIRDLNDKTLKAAVTAYKPKKNETVTTNRVGVSGVSYDAEGGVATQSGGFVAGTGEYTSGSKLTLTAEARPGWAFVGWRRVGDAAPYQTKAKWQVVVTNDVEYVAVFEKIPYVRGLADPADGGKVSGSGLCAAGKKVTLKATANKNFTFLGWRQGTGNGEWGTGNGIVATTATLVIDRSAKPAASSKTSTTITELDGDVTYYAVFKSDPKVTVAVEATDEKGDALTGKGAGKYVAGTITGAGKYAPGKKVTLKAAANKGYVFSRWEKTGNGEWGTGNEEGGTGNGEVWSSQAASITLVMPSNDVAYVAKFITADEDKASIELEVNGAEMRRVEDAAPYQTNVWCGVYLEWPVAASALSATTVKVAGLPAGLKFADKPVTSKVGTGKTAVTVTNVPAYTIYGAPTAASKIDAKTDTAKPSEVKLTVTTAGKSFQVYQIDATVDALPTWAVGTFEGGVRGSGTPAASSQEEGSGESAASPSGVVSLTVSATGKVSGKALGDGLTYTLAAPWFSDVECPESDVDNPVFHATVIGKSGKVETTNDVTVAVEEVAGARDARPYQRGVVNALAARSTGDTDGSPVQMEWTAWQNLWKVEPWKTLGKNFDKKTMSYAILSDGTFSESEEDLTSALGADVTGRVTLKLAASGAVTVSGEFVTGYNEKSKKYTTVKVTGSATLVPVDEEGCKVFIYLTPKGLPPHARCIDVPWPEE